MNEKSFTVNPVMHVGLPINRVAYSEFYYDNNSFYLSLYDSCKDGGELTLTLQPNMSCNPVTIKRLNAVLSDSAIVKMFAELKSGSYTKSSDVMLKFDSIIDMIRVVSDKLLKKGVIDMITSDADAFIEMNKNRFVRQTTHVICSQCGADTAISNHETKHRGWDANVFSCDVVEGITGITYRCESCGEEYILTYVKDGV